MSPRLMTTGDAGCVATPQTPQSKEPEAYARAEAARPLDDDPRLRLSKAVTGYHFQATDGDIGHLMGVPAIGRRRRNVNRQYHIIRFPSDVAIEIASVGFAQGRTI